MQAAFFSTCITCSSEKVVKIIRIRLHKTQDLSFQADAVSILVLFLSMFVLDLLKALPVTMMKTAQEGGGEHAEKHSRL